MRDLRSLDFEGEHAVKDSGFRNRRLSALSTSALLATGMFALTGCTIVVDSRDVQDQGAADTGYDTRARVGLGWHVEGKSLARYKQLDQKEHSKFDRKMWVRVLAGINEDGVDRTDRFRTYYNAPDHHQAHADPGSVRDWILKNKILPSNPRDVDEDPGEMIYFWDDGEEYCVHEHDVMNSPTPFTVTLPSSKGKITAGVKLTVTWRLSVNYPGAGK